MNNSRAGFTLVELLVVISLVLVLASLALLVVPQAMDNQRASQGGVRVQGSLITAQQRAVLDRAPRGVRLLQDANGLVTRIQFIERPDDFTGGQVATGVDNLHLVFTGVDLSGGSSAQPMNTWPVQAGDYIEIQGCGLMHQIASVDSTTTMTLVSPLPQAISTPTAKYRIERASRLVGEEALEMPVNVAVDLSLNTKYGNPLPPATNNAVDILFSPKGEVLGNTGASRVILWVRDVTLSDEFQGSPSLIVVYPRSGQIAAFEVNTNNGFTGTNGLQYPYALVP
jgi:prepilin-type N-terminal cleavage/methylation domain-containing protein